MGSGREKDKKLKRRRRRKKKLKALKTRLAESKNLEERERLIEKIKSVSIYPSKLKLPK